MHLDIFSEGKSIFHVLDPRTKILCFIPLVFLIAILQDGVLVLLYFIVSVVCLFIAKIKLSDLASRIIAVNVFTLLIWATLPFSVPGEALFVIHGCAYTMEGVHLATLIFLKANTILFLTISMIGTTDVFSLAHALFHLKFPKKLVYLCLFLYRYISVLHQEYNTMQRTVKVRGFIPRTNFLTVKTYALMVGMLFINSYERAGRIYQAMVLRGFRGDFPMLQHFHFHRIDKVFSAVAVLFVFISFFIRIYL